MSGKRSMDPEKSDQLLRALLIVLLALVVIAGGLYLFVQVKLGAINRVEPDEYNEEVSVEEVSAPVAVDWGTAKVATSVDGVVNVLLVGQDSRTGKRERSDTMILFSINKNSNQLTMVSLMRDLYVQIPGYGGRKLNAAYQLGGFDLLDQTISDNFGVVVDYNVEVDFSGFKDIVDSLGGVDVELTQEEVDYLSGGGAAYTHGRTYDVVLGQNHLDGKAALDYARARHVEGAADFGRTQRQRKLLKIVYNDLKKASWLKLLGVYDSVADNITTDMNNTQILSIAFSAYSMGKKDINSYRIPASGMYYGADFGGELNSMLVPKDWDETRQLLQDYLYSEDGGKAAYEAMVERYGTQGSMDD